MFSGNYTHAMDDKGRVSLPAAFRRVVQNSGADRIMITTTDDPCLWGFTMDSWQRRVIDRIKGLSLMDPRVKAFTRLFVANAVETPIDSQGRILLPPPLRLHAQLDKDIFFTGAVEIFEIWHPARWSEAMAQQKALLTRGDGGLDPII